MNSILLLADSIMERTLINFAIFAGAMLVLLLDVFVGKSKFLNNSPEMKRTVVIIAIFAFVGFVSLYIFVKIG